jgi:hypothetical protein
MLKRTRSLTDHKKCARARQTEQQQPPDNNKDRQRSSLPSGYRPARDAHEEKDMKKNNKGENEGTSMAHLQSARRVGRPASFAFLVVAVACLIAASPVDADVNQFYVTRSVYGWSVPADASNTTVTLWGAGGGAAQSNACAAGGGAAPRS